MSVTSGGVVVIIEFENMRDLIKLFKVIFEHLENNLSLKHLGSTEARLYGEREREREREREKERDINGEKREREKERDINGEKREREEVFFKVRESE